MQSPDDGHHAATVHGNAVEPLDAAPVEAAWSIIHPLMTETQGRIVGPVVDDLAVAIKAQGVRAYAADRIRANLWKHLGETWSDTYVAPLLRSRGDPARLELARSMAMRNPRDIARVRQAVAVAASTEAALPEDLAILLARAGTFLGAMNVIVEAGSRLGRIAYAGKPSGAAGRMSTIHGAREARRTDIRRIRERIGTELLRLLHPHAERLVSTRVREGGTVSHRLAGTRAVLGSPDGPSRRRSPYRHAQWRGAVAAALVEDIVQGALLQRLDDLTMRHAGLTVGIPMLIHEGAGPFEVRVPVGRGAIRFELVTLCDVGAGLAPVSIELPRAGDMAKIAIEPADLDRILDGHVHPGLDDAASRLTRRLRGDPDFEDWTFESEDADTVIAAVASAEAIPSRAWKAVTDVADEEGVSLVMSPSNDKWRLRDMVALGFTWSDARLERFMTRVPAQSPEPDPGLPTLS